MAYLALIAGILIAGIKGLLMPFREPELLRDGFGLFEPRVVAAMAAARREPWRLTHHLTNVAVEWTRAEPQRATKALAAFALVGWMLAVML